MEQSGAVLKETGCTNRTRIRDYEKAVTENTGALLKVHTSNYKILGFTEEVSVEELAALGKKYHIPVIVDLGSGVLTDLENSAFPTNLRCRRSFRKARILSAFPEISFWEDHRQE